MILFSERKDKEKGIVGQRSPKTKEEILSIQFCDFLGDDGF